MTSIRTRSRGRRRTLSRASVRLTSADDVIRPPDWSLPPSVTTSTCPGPASSSAKSTRSASLIAR